MQSVTFAIEGMHCAGCVHTVDHLLRRQVGVWEVEVSLDSASARVLFDSQRISSQQIAEVIERAGYRASVSK